MRTVTCHTEGCDNAGIELDVITDFPDPDDPDGPLVTVTAVACGVCGQTIDDVAPPLDQPLDLEAAPR